MPEVRGMNDMGGPEAWFHSLPFITKYWLALAIVSTCMANFQLMSPMSMLWSFELIRQKFEIWRLVTPFVYLGKFSFFTFMTILNIVTYSKQYEMGTPYNTGAGGGTADYAFMILFGMICILISYPMICLLTPIMPLFSSTLLYYVVYIWSKRNHDAPANIWGIGIKAQYLPWLWLGITIVMGGPFFELIHGILIGHIYYYLVHIVPLVYGKDVLHTPQFLINYFGLGEYQYVAPAPARVQGGRPLGAMGNNTWAPPVGRRNEPAPAPAAGTGRYNWGGQGHVLGTN